MVASRPSEEGASAVEYGIMVALVAAMIIAVVIVVGNQTCEGLADTTQEASVAVAITTPGTTC